MRYLVTGCAGFIGSHLCERLLYDGQEVVGVDAFTDYYPRAYKERNLDGIRDSPGFTLVEGELTMLPLERLLPAVALRYFTVYGARQRPDMAFHRFIQAAFAGEAITVHDDGNQTRDFTHVSDVVQANVLAGERQEALGHVYNIAGGSCVTLRHVLAVLERVIGRESQILYGPAQAGDVRDTYADVSAANRDLGYEPTTSIEVGITDEVAWYAEKFLPSLCSAPQG